MPTIAQAPYIWLLLSCFSITQIHAQSIVEISGSPVIDGCDTLQYDLIVRSPQADQALSIRFSESVTYIANSLAEEVTELSDGVYIELSAYEGCDLIRGTITIVPHSLDFLSPFEAIAYLDDDVEETSQVISFVRRSFVNLDFSPYTYDVLTNQVSKVITITNVTDQPINQLSIAVSIDADFANVEGITGASVYGDSLVSISQEDFNNYPV